MGGGGAGVGGSASTHWGVPRWGIRRGPLTGEEGGSDEGPKGLFQGIAHLAAVVSFQEAHKGATA